MQKRAVEIAIAALTALALAGCAAPAESAPVTVASAAPAEPKALTGATPTASLPLGARMAPNPGPADPATHPKCESVAWVETWREEDEEDWQTEMYGEPVDTGIESMASGDPELGADGALVAYTVTAGDVINAIAARFCVDAVHLTMINGLWDDYYATIHPGDRLILRPDPSSPVVVSHATS